MNTEFTIVEQVTCDTCKRTMDSFQWWERKDGVLVNILTECYECDMDTDPQTVKDMEEIEELL